MTDFKPSATENNKDFPFVRAQSEFESRPMRPIRETCDADYMTWGSEASPYVINRGLLSFPIKNI